MQDDDQPDLESLTNGLPTPDIDDILRDVPKGYSEAASEAREGEVIPEPEDEALIELPGSSDEDDWVDASSSSAVTTRFEYDPTRNELPADAIEVLRVYRDLSDGKLIFHMKDRIFAAPQEIQESPLSKRFSAIVEAMVKFEGALRWRPSAPPRPIPPSTSTQEIIPQTTIGNQIEDFLQRRLAVHPEFAGRRIHIRPSRDGGVIIEVDGHFYEAVADIPDDRVRAFLQTTIEEWSDHH